MVRTVAPDEVIGPKLRAKFDEAARREKAEKARAKKPGGAKVSPEADDAGEACSGPAGSGWGAAESGKGGQEGAVDGVELVCDMGAA